MKREKLLYIFGPKNGNEGETDQDVKFIYNLQIYQCNCRNLPIMICEKHPTCFTHTKVIPASSHTSKSFNYA